MDKPILFSTPMVQAILDGRKSMTRRVVKPQPMWIAEPNVPFKTPDADPKGIIKPPYQPGDHLWVRETWTKYYYSDENGYTHYDQPMIYYAADGEPDFRIVDGDGFGIDDQRIKWKPSIHMPKEAARIWLEVTDIRAERLQSITWKDALSEGIDHINKEDAEICDFCPLEDNQKGVKNYGNGPSFCFDGGPCDEAQLHFKDDCVDCFSELWDSINAKRGYGWDTNCWVWVIEFRRVNP